MLARGFLRVDEGAVDDDLEGASLRGDEHEVVDGMLELTQDGGRQTDGPVEVASDRAVLDGYLHDCSRRHDVRDAPHTMLIEMSASGTGVLDPAPPRARWGGGGGGGWAWLLTASDALEAEIVRGFLEATGVPVALDWRDPSPFAWMHLSGNLHRPVPVYVPTGMVDTARLELMEMGLALEEDSAPLPAVMVMRERHRFLWQVVLALTVIAVAWILFVEIFGFAPCALRLFCI